MEREIELSVQSLLAGKLLLYPTDTVWGIGCDATDSKAVAKVFELKRREESKSLVILVASLEMLEEYISTVPDEVLEILKQKKKPTTIIYKQPKGLAKNTIASDDTVAIRIPKHKFCQKLIQKLGKPIVSTSANISGEPTPKAFTEISQAILDGVDYIVNLEREKIASKSSTILRIVGQDIEVIRE